MKHGIVKRVTGPVVDVQFPAGHLPDIYNAIEIQLEDRKVVMEAMQQLGSDTVRCVSLFSTDGISRGCTAVDTGSPVTMPVGEATLGRMFNVVGAAVAALCILLALGLLASLMGWVWQDLNQSLMSLINTAVSVVLHPVGDAVIQLS